MTSTGEGAARFERIVPGDRLPPFERTPTKAQLVMYAGAEDDYMPVHFDHQYATAAGQPGVINHGWLTYAILLQAVTAWADPEWADIVATRCRYRRPTFPDRTVVCSGVVFDKRTVDGARLVDVELAAHDPDGQLTTSAQVTLRFA